MTITPGFWLIPLVITILSLIPLVQFKPATGDYAAFGNAVGVMIYGGFWLITSLVAWLIYFIIV
jgi:hypothetical protein